MVIEQETYSFQAFDTQDLKVATWEDSCITDTAWNSLIGSL
jgi:hypothetical protein